MVPIPEVKIATPAESDRPEMEKLPCTQGEHELSEDYFKQGLKKMRTDKATGPDQIPVKLYKGSAVAVPETPTRTPTKIWKEEDVPIKFARAIFVMIYKNKGSSNDPTKYRCIGLLSHACLHGVQPVPAKATGRGDRVLRVRLPGSGRHVIAGIYNILTPRTISDEMLELGQKMYVTFIDYSAVFDSVSHKYF